MAGTGNGISTEQHVLSKGDVLVELQTMVFQKTVVKELAGHHAPETNKHLLVVPVAA